MDLSNKSKWLEKVYSARNNQELAKGYDEWAEDYDQDVLSFGYKIPAIMTGLIGRYMTPENGKMLDAGVGTGILGETLALMGYNDIIGIDISEGMMEIARKKGVHLSLHRMTLGEHLDFPDNTFTGSVAMGVFTLGHAPPESLDELIRITESGGYVIFSVRNDVYLNKGFKEKQDALEKGGKWQLLEKTDAFQALPLIDSKLFNRVFVYRVS
ncbi:class I SAM-dependent DNA methyltransferase [Thermodesulfobacteriota bacterium]